MDKMIVAVFEDEDRAYEGLSALKDLNFEGSLTLYAAAVIAKDAKGVVSLKHPPDRDLFGTVLGFATGALIGLIGGPVGFAVGATIGTLGGGLYDLAEVGVNNDFLTDISKALSPGKVAVVAEVDEEWVTPLDTRMEALGTTVLRQPRLEFVDVLIERQVAADKAELAELKAEHKQAVGEAKAKLEARIDAAQKRLQARRDQMNKKIEAMKREWDAKIQSLEEQAATAKGERKARLEKRIAEERALHKVRAEKLSQAWQLIKEAAATL